MRKSAFIKIIILTGLISFMQTGPYPQAEANGSGKHPILCYIPNRLFDILDIIRLRVRVGVGLSAGARVTKLTNVFAGGHTTMFAGLYGARGKPEIPWPAGVENHAGVDVSIADASLAGPYIDPLELGLEAQATVIGFSFGIELYEILDFVTGLVFIDLQKDDF